MRILIWILCFIYFVFVTYAKAEETIIVGNKASVNHGFPRIMAMAIGNKHYDDQVYKKNLAKADIVILGFYPGWGKYKGKHSERGIVKALKKMNPNILVGQYTILNEAPSSNNMKSASRDLGRKIDKEGWWLRNSNGERVQWTKKYNNWDVNITSKVKKDRDGLRYPKWLARRDYRIYFNKIPEFDIWYLDNAISRPAVKEADWDLDRRNEKHTDLEVGREYRLGNIAEWNEIKRLKPNVLLIGNSDDISSQEYRYKLNGVFMEALIGKKWSMERRSGWKKIMERYRQSMMYTKSPHLVGFNVWGKKYDFQRMRYGLTSCLLNDGYFTYTDEDNPYSSVPWFDEFDIDLGMPLEPQPLRPWKNGVFRRLFENGMVLVNPGPDLRKIVIDPGYIKFSGKQDSKINNGQLVHTVNLKSKDGLLLVRIRLK